MSPQPSEPVRRRRGPPPGAPDGPRRIGESLGVVTSRLTDADPRSLGALFSRWEEIAGPRLAHHVRPLRVADGVLVVAVDQPAWATQVRALGPVLLAKTGEVTGHFPVRLEVTVRRR